MESREIKIFESEVDKHNNENFKSAKFHKFMNNANGDIIGIVETEDGNIQELLIQYIKFNNNDNNRHVNLINIDKYKTGIFHKFTAGGGAIVEHEDGTVETYLSNRIQFIN